MIDAGDEIGRRRAHAAFGLPALAMPCLGWKAAALLAAWATVVNVAFLPRTTLGRGWSRPGERWGGGIVAYPITVLALMLICRERTLPAAAGWATMAFGDVMAATLGRRRPIAPLRWNPAKSLGGLLGFLLGAVPALLVVQRMHGVPPLASLACAIIAASLGALVESLRSPIPDNAAVGAATALVFGGLAGIGAL